MWRDGLAALALALVIEGVMPFISPLRFRQTLQRMATLPDQMLRIAGLMSMLGGLLLLYAVRHL